MIGLATCSFTEFRPDMGAPVRASVGTPRYRLQYTLAGVWLEVAPARSMLTLDEEPYEALYRRRLDAIGLDTLRAQAEAFGRRADSTTVVLLCFERLSQPGNWCHRRMFARWWLERTGQDVPELGATLVDPPTPLF